MALHAASSRWVYSSVSGFSCSAAVFLSQPNANWSSLLGIPFRKSTFPRRQINCSEISILQHNLAFNNSWQNIPAEIQKEKVVFLLPTTIPWTCFGEDSQEVFVYLDLFSNEDMLHRKRFFFMSLQKWNINSANRMTIEVCERTDGNPIRSIRKIRWTALSMICENLKEERAKHKNGCP